jgi:bifunctional non-homologous end joining protein LigD
VALPRGAELFQPMLASGGKDASPPSGSDWVFEPKYDGIRILALASGASVALMTRNGRDKCRQFPEITEAVRALSRAAKRNLVLDGEIVALDGRGRPSRFQDLQGRMHLLDVKEVDAQRASTPTALIAFDMLLDGAELLVNEDWDERRAHLERTLRASPSAATRVLRLSDVAYGEPDAMLRDARAHGWEGVMAKRRDGPYEPGRRVSHWRKLKLDNRQELVVAGWTEPRNSRMHFGALLLGYYDAAGELVYAGHTGTGFSDAQLREIGRALRKIETSASPFRTAPKTNERPHWAEPRYVAEIRFNEWTTGGQLRQPVFVGWREDKDPKSVVRESNARTNGGHGTSDMGNGKPRSRATARGSRGTAVAEELRRNPDARALDLQLDKKTKLAVTNLGKMFFPVAKITKGRLLEYYAEVAPFLLPALADRPLVLKRWPNGIVHGGEFYQQKAPEKAPAVVRIEKVKDEGIETERRLIGGDLATLLYTIQLGAISTDPWHSRVQSIADADYSIIDLDPGPKATFKRVVNVARWVKEELDELGLHAIPKTSGASGIHIVLPLPRGASYEVSRVLAELVARRVNEKHPKETTVVRAVKARPADAVYVDYLQNIRGKTVASVYSCRAEPRASCSTPLKWSEITSDLDPRDFTIETLPKRLKRVGDLWALGMRKTNRLPGVVGEGDAAA